MKDELLKLVERWKQLGIVDPFDFDSDPHNKQMASVYACCSNELWAVIRKESYKEDK